MKEASPAAVVEGPPEFSEHERYLFDLHGVMQVEDALTAEQCDRLNAALDAEIAARQEAGLAFQNSPEWFGDEEKPAQTLRLGDMADPALGMDKEFLKLVDNPRVSCYLDAMYTSPHFAEGSSKAAAFRIDHICKCQRSLCLLSEAQVSTIRRRHHQSARLARRAGGQDDRRPDRHGPAQDRLARCLLPDGEWQDVQRPAHRGLPAPGRRPGAGRLVSTAAPFKTRLPSNLKRRGCTAPASSVRTRAAWTTTSNGRTGACSRRTRKPAWWCRTTSRGSAARRAPPSSVRP